MTIETFDPNAWETALVEDLRANGGRRSQARRGHPIMLMWSIGAKTGSGAVRS